MGKHIFFNVMDKKKRKRKINPGAELWQKLGRSTLVVPRKLFGQEYYTRILQLFRIRGSIFSYDIRKKNSQTLHVSRCEMIKRKEEKNLFVQFRTRKKQIDQVVRGMNFFFLILSSCFFLFDPKIEFSPESTALLSIVKRAFIERMY